MHKSALQSSTDDASLSPWKTHSNGQQLPKPDMDDTMSFGVATPLLKSFMTQVYHSVKGPIIQGCDAYRP